jgi:hypothetical protein
LALPYGGEGIDWGNLAGDLGLVSPLFGPKARFQAFLELSGLKLVSSFLGSA